MKEALGPHCKSRPCGKAYRLGTFTLWLLAIFLLAPLAHAQRPLATETALQMQSWCKPIVDAPTMANGNIDIDFGGSPEARFCWGAFAIIQQFTRYEDKDHIMMLGICAPPTSSRRQFVMIFSKYVDQHLEAANEHFADIAYRALLSAFPCGGSR